MSTSMTGPRPRGLEPEADRSRGLQGKDRNPIADLRSEPELVVDLQRRRCQSVSEAKSVGAVHDLLDSEGLGVDRNHDDPCDEVVVGTVERRVDVLVAYRRGNESCDVE